jgi:transcriptional regulator with XRE-family HTH domain
MWFVPDLELQPEYRQIGEALRRLRRERDLSQESVASSCGMSRSALANIEAGQQRLAVHHLLALARVLGVDAASLLPDAGARSLQPLDRELVDKGVPEAAARAVARMMGEYEGDEIAASTRQSRAGRTPAARRGRRDQAAGSG